MLYTHKLPQLTQAVFIKRYKRFMVDVHHSNAQHTTTIHCPNSGSMKGLLKENMPVWMSHSDNPTRKLQHTLEIVKPDNTLIGVNTHRANTLVHEALQSGIFHKHYKHTHIKKEHKTSAHTRPDFMLQTDKGPVYLEVKNVTLCEKSHALFPDAVTTRGTKHMQHLNELAQISSVRCGVVFLVQRNDCNLFSPAQHVDAHYTQALLVAHKSIDIHILSCHITEQEIHITHATTAPPASQPPWPTSLT